MSYRIIVEPFGIVADIQENETILQAIQRAGVEIAAYCNGQGVCGKCKIKIIEGYVSSFGGITSSRENISPMSATECAQLTEAEKQAGYRFACMTKVYNDIVIEIPRESYLGEQVILESGTERTVAYHPAIKSYTIRVEKPTLSDAKDDFSRIKKKLLEDYKELDEALSIRFEALRQLPELIRKGAYCITVFILYGKEIIKVKAGEVVDCYGLAIDIGTTTIAMYLCDLKDGKQLTTSSAMNPQIKYGDDVLTRISYCQDNENGLELLNKVLYEELNRMIEEITKSKGIEIDDILEAVLVSNTVMEHIALRISPNYLGNAPFAPALSDSIDAVAKEVGIHIFPEGNVHYLPVEAAFVGADNVAVLIAEEPYKQKKIKLIIDIGTNSEICLGNEEIMYSTSCATGPALEGAQIYCGMRAAKGAISKVIIHPKTLEPTIEIIGQTEYPIGICGSGIIDTVAQMALTGIIDPDGKFSKNIQSKRIREDEKGKKEYVLYFAKNKTERDIVVKQKDVRAVQLAKAALYAGSKALMKKIGVSAVDEVVLAGGFGSYIDKNNALELGMFPDCELEKVIVSGNAAGMGAKLALWNIEKRHEARKVAKEITFVETATDAQYQMMFAQAMAIPHEKDAFYKNKTIKWQCQRHQPRELPEQVLAMNETCLTCDEAFSKAMEFVEKREEKEWMHLPLVQNIEAVSYGGKMDAIGSGFAIKEATVTSLEELSVMKNNLINTKEIQVLLNYISNHKEQTMVLDVEGPFTILSGIMGMNRVLRLSRKEGKQIHELFDKIACDLAEYVREAVNRGVKIISFAEPDGSIDIVGKKYYKDFIAPAIMMFMKLVSPYLKSAVVHICGKSSIGLVQSGFVVEKRYRTKEKEYIDILLDMANDKRTKFVGNGCLNQKKLVVPIITKFELSSLYEDRKELF